MINRMLGLLGPFATAPPPPSAPPMPVAPPRPAPPAAALPPPAPPLADGLTNVTAVVALAAAAPSETVRVIVKVPGVALVSVALVPIGLSMAPPVLAQ